MCSLLTAPSPLSPRLSDLLSAATLSSAPLTIAEEEEGLPQSGTALGMSPSRVNIAEADLLSFVDRSERAHLGGGGRHLDASIVVEEPLGIGSAVVVEHGHRR